MLQHDYLTEAVQLFVEAVSVPLSRALRRQDMSSAREVETAIAELLEMDRDMAMGLAPESLVTMMRLMGTGDSTSEYVAYTLDRLGDAYERMGEGDLARLRHEQAAAIGEAFGSDPTQVPEELLSVEDAGGAEGAPAGE